MTSKIVSVLTDPMTYKIIGLAMEVHSQLGPGLKEQMYQKAMEEQLDKSGLNYEAQKQLEVYIGARRLGLLFLDILVEESVIVELKALSHMVTNNELSQVLTYLKVGGYKVGLLINFGRKYLQYKRIFPPIKFAEVTKKDLRFGVRFATLQTNIETNKRMGLKTNDATNKRIKT